MPIYSDGMQVRDWLYVDDHCRAILAVLQKGREGEVYNVGESRALPKSRCCPDDPEDVARVKSGEYQEFYKLNYTR